ncbi:MAG: DUF2807 domain-containing protein [Muribaculaceae bacterium]|nr:DUF2807 domain-containing protein [Muribaculaceae bacterium]
MKKIFYFVLLLTIMSSCASSLPAKIMNESHSKRSFSADDTSKSVNPGPIKTRRVAFDKEVTNISNYTLVDIEYLPGKPGIEITGPENLIKLIMVQQSGSSLAIHADSEGYNYSNFKNISAKIYGKSLTHFQTFGTGNFKASDLSGKKITLGLYGTGNIQLNSIDAPSVSLMDNGTGEISIKSINSSSVSIMNNGTGKISVGFKESQSSVNILSNGTGDIFATNISTEKLSIQNHGAGDVEVSGEATTANFNTSGIGDIDASRLKTEKSNVMQSGLGDIKR